MLMLSNANSKQLNKSSESWAFADDSTSWHVHKIFDKPQEKSGSSLFRGFFIVSHIENQFFDLWF